MVHATLTARAAARRIKPYSFGVIKRRRCIGSNIPHMKVTTGTVVDGKVLVEGEALPEGSTVTVLVQEDEKGFDLTPEEEAELLASIADIESGKFISGDELLQRLRRSG
jgi:hypothetical protein